MPEENKKDVRGIRLNSEDNYDLPIGKSWFLGIGIDKYQDASIPPLNNAKKDVKDILALLEKKYELDHVVTLFDEEASKNNILWELDKLVDKVQPNDKLLICFSGHGVLDSRSNKGYWVTFDGKLDRIKTNIPNVLVKDSIEDINSRHTLLIADACFSGTLLFTTGRKRVAALMKDLEKLKSRLVITSGRHFQLVNDGHPGKNSPFAASILETLGDDNLSQEMTFTKFSDTVRRRTSELNSSQSPVFGRLNLDDDEGGEYIFRLKLNEDQIWVKRFREGTVVALSQFLVEFPRGKYANMARKLVAEWEEEDKYWDSIFSQDRISLLHEYLEQYQHGRYIPKAKVRLKILQDRARIIKSTNSSNLNQFTDPRDGRQYKVVKINGLPWMAENLSFDTGEGCLFYNDARRNGEKYGRLYTWEAAKMACPPGWRLPTDGEWKALTLSMGGLEYENDGGEFGNPQMAYSALIENGSSGFNAVLGGKNLGHGCFYLNEIGYYWTDTEANEYDAWKYVFNHEYKTIVRGKWTKRIGYSVRCVMDWFG